MQPAARRIQEWFGTYGLLLCASTAVLRVTPRRSGVVWSAQGGERAGNELPRWRRCEPMPVSRGLFPRREVAETAWSDSSLARGNHVTHQSAEINSTLLLDGGAACFPSLARGSIYFNPISKADGVTQCLCPPSAPCGAGRYLAPLTTTAVAVQYPAGGGSKIQPRSRIGSHRQTLVSKVKVHKNLSRLQPGKTLARQTLAVSAAHLSED